jgi:hypothetical protein
VLCLDFCDDDGNLARLRSVILSAVQGHYLEHLEQSLEIISERTLCNYTCWGGENPKSIILVTALTMHLFIQFHVLLIGISAHLLESWQIIVNMYYESGLHLLFRA